MRADMGAMRTEVREELRVMRAELREDLRELRGDVHDDFGGPRNVQYATLLTLLAGLLGIIATLLAQ